MLWSALLLNGFIFFVVFVHVPCFGRHLCPWYHPFHPPLASSPMTRSCARPALGVKQGISNEADNAQRQEHLRPRRALTKDSETGQLILTNFSMEAAEAQARKPTSGTHVALGYLSVWFISVPKVCWASISRRNVLTPT